MKPPNASTSITGFSLYEIPYYESEIDSNSTATPQRESRFPPTRLAPRPPPRPCDYPTTKKGSTSSASTTRRVRHLLCGRRADKDLERRLAHELQISDGQLPGSPPGSTTVTPHGQVPPGSRIQHTQQP